MTDVASAPAVPAQAADLAGQIARSELPAFGANVAQMLRAADDEASSGSQLAETVLRDPALTGLVLRAANAARYGYSGDARVATVSRAVVVLGVQALRSLCLSALAVEHLGHAAELRDRLDAALARALHAAEQARDLAAARGLRREAGEKLYVSALLGELGELAFWCHGGEAARRLDAELTSGADPAAAEKRVLGKSLQAFGRELLAAWQLDDLLLDSPDLDLARRVARAGGEGRVAAGAWRELVRAAAVLGGIAEDEAARRLQATAERAAGLADSLRAPRAAQRIRSDAGAPPAGSDSSRVADAATSGPPDRALQARLLAEVAQVATSRRDLPLLFQTALEGMHRAVGLDRCVLCLLTPARDRLQARLLAGLDTDALREALQWSMNPELDALLGAHGARHLHGPQHPPPPVVLRACRQTACALVPLRADHKVIGLFYADCQPSGRAVSEAQFEGMRDFVAQVERVLRHLPR